MIFLAEIESRPQVFHFILEDLVYFDRLLFHIPYNWSLLSVSKLKTPSILTHYNFYWTSLFFSGAFHTKNWFKQSKKHRWRNTFVVKFVFKKFSSRWVLYNCIKKVSCHFYQKFTIVIPYTKFQIFQLFTCLASIKRFYLMILVHSKFCQVQWICWLLH